MLQVLPQGSVKAKPSAAIGAALGPHLVLPNGNVSGPRACAPVEAFELPGSVAKNVVPGPTSSSAGNPASGSGAYDFNPANLAANAGTPGQSRLPNGIAAAAGPAASNAAARAGQQSAGNKAVAPQKPKPKPPLRPMFEGEERKRGPAGRTSMYKVRLISCICRMFWR